MNSLLFLFVFYPILSSPVAMWMIRQVCENGYPVGIFNWKTQSWAFMFGDTLSLPLTVFWALRTLRKPETDTSLLYQWWWSVLAVVVGVAVTIGFRKMDEGGYTATGNADRLFAPTKLWHDFVVYFTVSVLVFFVAVPVFLTGSVDGYVTAAFFLSWLAFGICDMFRGLNPAHMHPRVQETALGGWT